MAYETLRYEPDGHVVVLTYDRPEQRNAISRQMNAVFGALERRWNIVAGDGMTVRLPLVVGYSKAMELIITGRAVDAREAERIGLANEVVPEGQSLERAVELAHEIARLPQGAIRSDKETLMR